jgi:uncharacterized membrane protein (UPF0127 family)
MRLLTVRNKTRGSILGDRVRLADTFLNRLRGLAGSSKLGWGEGLLLSPCRAVHTIGCIRPLDVVFIDRRGSVVAVYTNLRPMRVTRWVGEAEYALELPGGTISSTGTQVRDRLAWVPSPGPCVDPFIPNPYEGRDAAGTPLARSPWTPAQRSSREAKNASRES